jgi:hypothetical protein
LNSINTGEVFRRGCQSYFPFQAVIGWVFSATVQGALTVEGKFLIL